MTATGPTRRQFLLGTAGLAATAGLAGCQGTAATLEPQLPPGRLEESGWEQVADIDDEATEELEVAGTTQRVTVETRADVYENDRPVQRVADRFSVDADEAAVPGEMFVAAKARVDPPVTRLLDLSDTVLTQAMDVAEDQAISQLRQEGLQNVRRVDEGTLDIEAGATAHHRRYQADYPYESYEVTYEGVPLVVEAGTFTIEAQLAIWPFRGLLALGAGLYPGVAGELAVSYQGATRDLALELRPDRYRADVRELIQLVS